ncbi:MAG: iron ABC transporter permease [Oscillospiraceae bacterium]|jgi:iron complex transport system permease protein|nr:iron ABC transporter permease [Oscillospiraceae bacterium]
MPKFTHTDKLISSASVRARYARRCAALTAALIAVFVVSFFLGRYKVSPESFWRIFTSPFTGGDLSDISREVSATLYIRLPRVLAALLIGAALSTAGASYQGMFRNPMVSPDILGASTGAGFGAALAILLSMNYFGIMTLAFAGGMGAVLLAYLVSRSSRLDGTLSLVLAGVMISSLFSAGTSFIKLIADTDNQLPAITYWLMGSLSSIKLEDLPFAAIPIAAGLIPLILLRWRINLLTTGADEAKSLGVNVAGLRLAVIVCATLMTAASVAVSGMIGWIGLVIPHFVRLIFGYDYRRIIPMSAILGAAFLLAVDNIARIATTTELPLGILTSFVGAPIFVYLIMTGGQRREH